MKVTYLENGVRSIRNCDNVEWDKYGTPSLIYHDGYDGNGKDLFRINILSPRTIIEHIE